VAFELPPLPYAPNALEPYTSAKTIALHYGKHHRAYVTKLNELIVGTPFETMSLEAVIRASQGMPDAQATFNNAAQHWNHCKFWHSRRPAGPRE
jgi:superoxide dismutase, Fe-Mn family